jgi:hypothetical protein
LATASTEPPEVTATTFSPASFLGYGDFSGMTYHEVDWHEIYTRAVRCTQNHGYPVRLTYDGGVNYQDVPSDTNAEAVRVFETCIQKMHAPGWSWPTEEEVRYKYAYALALIPCIRNEGYEVDDPPPIEEYIATWRTGPWTPRTHLPSTGSEAVSIYRKCPPSPVGGTQAWQPGDPIQPLPDY